MCVNKSLYIYILECMSIEKQVSENPVQNKLLQNCLNNFSKLTKLILSVSAYFVIINYIIFHVMYSILDIISAF